MFREILTHSNRFIAVHSATNGCKASDLIQHIVDDIVPHVCGFECNRTVAASALHLILNYTDDNGCKEAELRCDGEPLGTYSDDVVERVLDDSDGKYTLHASVALQERVLGIELKPFVTPFVFLVCDHAIKGLPRLPGRSSASQPTTSSSRKGGAKKEERAEISPGKWSYFRNQLVKERWLISTFMFDTQIHSIEEYCFPLFALPRPTNRSAAIAGGGGFNGGGSGGVGSPLDSYFTRSRQTNFPHLVPLDLSAVRQIVTSLTPPRQLVQQDFIYAFMALHNLQEEYPIFCTRYKHYRSILRRLCDATGLKVALATTNALHRTQRFRVVMPRSDYIQAKRNRRKVRSSASGSGDGNGASCEGERKRNRSERSSDDDGSSSDDASSQDSDDNGAVREHEPVSDGDELSVETSATGTKLFPVDPMVPIPVQVVQSARKGPITLDCVFPRVNLYDMKVSHNEMRRWARRSHALGFTQEKLRRSMDSKAFTLTIEPAPKHTPEPVCEDTPATDSLAVSSASPTQPASESTSGCPISDDVLRANGITSWSVCTILDALQESALRALTLQQLSSTVDRRTLSRALPVMREHNLVVTTGTNPTRTSPRIGIVALASANLSEAQKRAVVELQKAERANDAAKRKPVAAVELCETDLVNLNQVSSVVIAAATHVGSQAENSATQEELAVDWGTPQDVSTRRTAGKKDDEANEAGLSSRENGSRKTHVSRLLSDKRAATLENKIMLMRNGFSRHSQFRASRLHLELWHQWFDRGYPEGFTLQSIVANMSLSTFCIVMGVSSVDLAEFGVEGHHQESERNDRHEEARAATPFRLAWSSPMRLLPPALAELMQRSSPQLLLQAAADLQHAGLIECNVNLGANIHSLPSDAHVHLVACVSPSAPFHSTVERRIFGCTLRADQRYTLYDADTKCLPNEVFTAVLEYWTPAWHRAASSHRLSFVVYGAILHVQPQLSNAQVAAIAKAMRVDVGLVAEGFFQRNGVFPFTRVPSLTEIIRSVGTQMHERRRGTAQAGGGVVRTPRALLSAAKLVINAAAIAEAVQVALEQYDAEHAFLFMEKLLAVCWRTAHHSAAVQSTWQSRYVGAVSLLETMMRLAKSVSTARHETLLSVETLVWAASTVFSADLLRPVATLPNRAAPHIATPLPPTPVSQKESAVRDGGAPNERLQETIRMILLSDNPHCELSNITALLKDFTKDEVDQCVQWLHQFPAFRRSKRGRVGDIALGSAASLLPRHFGASDLEQSSFATAAHQFTSQLIHGLTATPSPSPVFGSSGTAWMSVVGQALRGEEQAQSDVSALHQEGGGGYALEHQPAVSREQLTEGLRDEQRLSTLLLPQLLWVQTATQPASTAFSSSANIGAHQRHATRHIGRHFQVSATISSNSPVSSAISGIDENAPPPSELTRHSPFPQDHAHPARIAPTPLQVRSHRAILGLPADTELLVGPRVWMDENEVPSKKRSRVHGGGTTASTPADESSVHHRFRFPSIFFHADGTFHEYVWRAVLSHIHSIVLRSPGVARGSIERQITSKGLVSTRSCQVALEYLVESGVLVEKLLLAGGGAGETCTSQGLWRDSSIPEGLSAERLVKRMRREATRSSTNQWEAAYWVQLNPLKPWSVLDL